MKKTRFINPFPREVSNQRAFRQRFRPGAYIIKQRGKIVYIGFSGTDVVRTMYRHFYPWNDSQYRVTFDEADKSIKVRIIYTNRPEQAQNLERALLKKYKPPLNYLMPSMTQTQKDQKIMDAYFSAQEVTEF